MKTAEEFYLEYFPPKRHLIRDHADKSLSVHDYYELVDFAQQFAERYAKAKVKAALEEVIAEAEKLSVNTKNLNDDVLVIRKESIRSLIPNQEQTIK